MQNIFLDQDGRIGQHGNIQAYNISWFSCCENNLRLLISAVKSASTEPEYLSGFCNQIFFANDKKCLWKQYHIHQKRFCNFPFSFLGHGFSSIYPSLEERSALSVASGL